MNIPVSLQPATHTGMAGIIGWLNHVPVLAEKEKDPVEACMKKIVVIYGLYKITKIVLKILIAMPVLTCVAIFDLLLLGFKVITRTYKCEKCHDDRLSALDMLKDLISILAMPLVALIRAFFDRLPQATRWCAQHLQAERGTMDLIPHRPLKERLELRAILLEQFDAVHDKGSKRNVTQELRDYLALIIEIKPQLKLTEKHYAKVKEMVSRVDFSDQSGKKSMDCKIIFAIVVQSYDIRLIEILCSGDQKKVKQALNTRRSGYEGYIPILQCIVSFSSRISELNEDAEKQKLFLQSIEIIKFLLKAGSDPNEPFHRQTTQFMRLCEMWSHEISQPQAHPLVNNFYKTAVELFIDHGAKLDDHFIFNAFFNNTIEEIDVVKKAINKGARLPLKRIETEAQALERMERVRIQRINGVHYLALDENQGIHWRYLIQNHKEHLHYFVSTLIAQNPDRENEVKANLTEAVRSAILLGNIHNIKLLQKAGVQLQYEDYLFLNQLFRWATSPIHAPLRIKPFTHNEFIIAETKASLWQIRERRMRSHNVREQERQRNWKRFHERIEAIVSGVKIDSPKVPLNNKGLLNVSEIEAEAFIESSECEIIIQDVSFTAMMQQLEWFVKNQPGFSSIGVQINDVINKIKDQQDIDLSEKDVTILNKGIKIFNQFLRFETLKDLPEALQLVHPALARFVENSKTLPPTLLAQDTQKCLSDVKAVYDPIFARIKQEITSQIAPAHALVNLVMDYSNGDHLVTIE